jgi:predicted MFS family arabinose efflux permease
VAVQRVVEALLPGRLSKNFQWIWASSTVANLGDGVLISAGPLLIASITREPFPIAMALFVQRLPWLLFGVVAGAVIDRLDRRRLIIVVDILRTAVLAVLALSIAFGYGNLPLIYAAMFVLGTAETFADNANSTIVAVAIPAEGIGQANARLMGAKIVTNQLAGPPLGAFLFGLGLAVPFGFNAVCFALSVAVIARITLPPPHDTGPRTTSMRTEVGEGLRWLWGHPPVRTLAIMITVFNITFGASFSIWVLYATERLGLSEVGFGFLLTASAVGGVLGSTVYTWLESRFSYAWLLRVGLIIETLTHLALVLTREAVVAGLVMGLFGIHAVVWGTTSTTVRHRAVPSPLLGRVTSVYLIGSVGALALGTLLGGAIAQRWGILAPFWFAFVGSAVTTALIWRSLTNVAHAAEVDDSVVPTA